MRINIPTMHQPLSFRYLNWKGDLHIYKVAPESIEFGPYTEHGFNRSEKNWVLNAECLERDGQPRLVGRRTFLLSKIEEVPAT